ncbi:hypothetical protein LMG29660_02222 [Burkholderia puraquae]|uniref:Uncharacterized protein n=1 Tax=Burkholderia puraquae TaxID=1904757 RepID=A0A6J5DLX3_9BURK|nr:hypothetical protein LMG29660_02222 [Burkholderia puraquae]
MHIRQSRIRKALIAILHACLHHQLNGGALNLNPTTAITRNPRRLSFDELSSLGVRRRRHVRRRRGREQPANQAIKRNLYGRANSSADSRARGNAQKSTSKCASGCRHTTRHRSADAGDCVHMLHRRFSYCAQDVIAPLRLSRSNHARQLHRRTRFRLNHDAIKRRSRISSLNNAIEWPSWLGSRARLHNDISARVESDKRLRCRGRTCRIRRR